MDRRIRIIREIYEIRGLIPLVNTVHKKIDLSAEVIVVGSGPGGATVARELSRKGKDVLILERGYDYRNKIYYGTYLGAMRYSERMGLLYTDLKRYDDALRHAHRAYALGFPLPGLQRKLARAGKWRDPEIRSSSGTAEEDESESVTDATSSR